MCTERWCKLYALGSLEQRLTLCMYMYVCAWQGFKSEGHLSESRAMGLGYMNAGRHWKRVYVHIHPSLYDMLAEYLTYHAYVCSTNKISTEKGHSRISYIPAIGCREKNENLFITHIKNKKCFSFWILFSLPFNMSQSHQPPIH